MSSLAHPSTLRALRERAGLSQRELAQRADVASNTIRNAEAGAVPHPFHREAIDRALRAALIVALVKEGLEEIEAPLVDWTATIEEGEVAA